MNKVFLIGNVCAKPEAHTTQNGVNRSTFRLAVRRKYRNADGNHDADFLTVVAWRQTADFCNNYLDRGRTVAVEGSIQTRSYTAQDGSKRDVTEIIADSVETVGGRKEAEQKPVQTPQQQRMDYSGSQFSEVEDDELPWEK